MPCYKCYAGGLSVLAGCTADVRLVPVEWTVRDIKSAAMIRVPSPLRNLVIFVGVPVLTNPVSLLQEVKSAAVISKTLRTQKFRTEGQTKKGLLEKSECIAISYDGSAKLVGDQFSLAVNSLYNALSNSDFVFHAV